MVYNCVWMEGGVCLRGSCKRNPIIVQRVISNASFEPLRIGIKKIRKSHSICFTSAFKMGANFGSLALPHCLLSVTSSCREWSSFR